MKLIKTFLIVFSTVLICGCSLKDFGDAPIKSTSVKKLNDEMANEFTNRSYDYFYPFEINNGEYQVRKFELNYYKDKEVKNTILLFMREVNGKDVPNLQYIYLGYNFNDEEKRNIDTYMYIYGPKIQGKYEYKYEHSTSLQPSTRTVDFDPSKKITPIERIEYMDSKYFIYPIVLDDTEDNSLKDATVEELINNGHEFLVLEVSLEENIEES